MSSLCQTYDEASIIWREGGEEGDTWCIEKRGTALQVRPRGLKRERHELLPYKASLPIFLTHQTLSFLTHLLFLFQITPPQSPFFTFTSFLLMDHFKTQTCTFYYFLLLCQTCSCSATRRIQRVSLKNKLAGWTHKLQPGIINSSNGSGRSGLIWSLEFKSDLAGKNDISQRCLQRTP